MVVTDEMVEKAMAILFPLNAAFNKGSHESLKAKTRNALDAAIALMRGQSEAVEVEAVAVVKRDSSSGAVHFDWLIEGGADELEQGAWLAVVPLPLPKDGSITLYKDTADEQ